MVSDHGAVFRAGDAVALLKAWEIEPTSLERRKPWPNRLEAPLKGQLRLADFKVEHARPVDESHQ
jgi:hypothetical protein